MMVQWQDCTFEEAVEEYIWKDAERDMLAGKVARYKQGDYWFLARIVDGHRQYLARHQGHWLDDIDSCNWPLRPWMRSSVYNSQTNDSGESWCELDGLRIEDNGWVTTTTSCYTLHLAKAGDIEGNWSVCLSEQGKRTCRELIRRWQSRQKPKLPTVEAPEGWEWFVDHGVVGMRNTQPDPNGGFTVFHLNDDKGVIAMARALLAAYDERNRGENA